MHVVLHENDERSSSIATWSPSIVYKVKYYKCKDKNLNDPAREVTTIDDEAASHVW
jgi:hypothetical protein